MQLKSRESTNGNRAASLALLSLAWWAPGDKGANHPGPASPAPNFQPISGVKARCLVVCISTSKQTERSRVIVYSAAGIFTLPLPRGRFVKTARKPVTLLPPFVDCDCDRGHHNRFLHSTC
ncbi:hypothetical protein BJX62DRAFT_210089 [Aspergillus germanicus]